MVIHVIQPGDTVASIAQQYNTSPSLITAYNGLSRPYALVVGESLAIVNPTRMYTVGMGDTLTSIAANHNSSVIELYQNNPSLVDRDYIYPGETIVLDVPRETNRTKRINGYAYPHVNPRVLRHALPYLTTLTIFGYGFTTEGRLIPIQDEPLIRMAGEFHTAPIMLISSITESGTFSNERAAEVFNDKDKQERLIQDIVRVMHEKGYVGLDVDFEFIDAGNKWAYINFVENVTGRLHENGFTVNVDLAPKTSADQPGLLYEAHDYAALGRIADMVLVMTYEWGYTYGPPMAVAPLNKVKEVLDYAVTEIEPAKVMMGVPNYGYDWKLPYVKGETAAKTLGNEEAVSIAADFGATIQFNETAMSPYFHYHDAGSDEHVVWFEDARSIQAKLRLLDSLNLLGAGYWSVMKPFMTNWTVLNSMFRIDKF